MSQTTPQEQVENLQPGDKINYKTLSATEPEEIQEIKDDGTIICKGPTGSKFEDPQELIEYLKEGTVEIVKKE